MQSQGRRAQPNDTVDNPQDRADLLGRSLEWMGVNDLFADGFESGDTSMWSATVP